MCRGYRHPGGFLSDGARVVGFGPSARLADPLVREAR